MGETRRDDRDEPHRPEKAPRTETRLVLLLVSALLLLIAGDGVVRHEAALPSSSASPRGDVPPVTPLLLRHHGGTIEVAYRTERPTVTRLRVLSRGADEPTWRGERLETEHGLRQEHRRDLRGLAPSRRYRLEAWEASGESWIPLGDLDLPAPPPPPVDWEPILASIGGGRGLPATPPAWSELAAKHPKGSLDPQLPFLRCAAFDARGALWLGGEGNRLRVLEGGDGRNVDLDEEDAIVLDLRAAGQDMRVRFRKTTDGSAWEVRIRGSDGAVLPPLPIPSIPSAHPLALRHGGRDLRLEDRRLVALEADGEATLLAELPSPGVALVEGAGALFVVMRSHGLLVLARGGALWVRRRGCSLAPDGRGKARETFSQLPLGPTGRIHGMQGWHPDAGLAALDTPEGVALWQLPARVPLPHVLPRGATSPVFSPDGKELAALGRREGDSFVHLVAPESPRALRSILLPRGAYGQLRWAAEGRLLLSRKLSSRPPRWTLARLDVKAAPRDAITTAALDTTWTDLPVLARERFDVAPGSDLVALFGPTRPVLGRLSSDGVYRPLDAHGAWPAIPLADVALLPEDLGLVCFGARGSLHTVPLEPRKAQLGAYALPSSEDVFWRIPPRLRVAKVQRRQGYVWAGLGWSPDGRAAIQSHLGGWVVLMERNAP